MVLHFRVFFQKNAGLAFFGPLANPRSIIMDPENKSLLWITTPRWFFFWMIFPSNPIGMAKRIVTFEEAPEMLQEALLGGDEEEGKGTNLKASSKPQEAFQKHGSQFTSQQKSFEHRLLLFVTSIDFLSYHRKLEASITNTS